MIRIIVALLCWVPVDEPVAQLQVDRPLNLDQSDSSVRVEALFPFAEGQEYLAVIQGGLLRMDEHVIRWRPAILCNDRRTRICRSRASKMMSWRIHGTALPPSDPDPGMYHGHALLSVQGPEETYTLTIPVTHQVHAQEVSCAVSAAGRLSFGHAEANQAGVVILSPQTSQYAYQRNQRQRLSRSPHQFATLTLITSTPSVLVTVAAPHELRSLTGRVGFSSHLAYQTTPGGRYRSLIRGSGSRRIWVHGGRIDFRLGGTVTTFLSSPEADYHGTVTMTFLCG